MFDSEDTSVLMDVVSPSSKTSIDESALAMPVRWMGDSDGRPGDEEAIGQWAARVTNDASSSVYMHPEMVAAASQQSTLPVVYGVWNDANEAIQPSALAVFSQRTLACAGLPGLPIGRSLASLKLTGDQFLSDGSEESAARFVQGLAASLRQGVADCAQFEEVEVDSPLWRALSGVKYADGVKAFFPLMPQRHWWIDFPEKPEDYWKKFSSKERSEFKRRVRKLNHEFVCVTRPEQVAGFLEKAAAVAAMTWQAKRVGGRLENTPDLRRSFEKLAQLGALRSYLLMQGEQPLAYNVSIQWNGCYVGEETGYDLQYANFAPGRVMFYRIMEDLMSSNTPSSLSMGFGDAEYKADFGTRSTMTAPIILARRSLRPMLYMGIDQLRRRTALAARHLFKDSSMMQFIRRKYRK